MTGNRTAPGCDREPGAGRGKAGLVSFYIMRGGR